MNIKANWDGLGIFTSLACAIHCAILPLIATSLPLFGINIIHNNLFEWCMIALAFCIGAYALYHGRKKHHTSWGPITIFAAGFVLLVIKQFLHPFEIYFLTPAVILIITAHYYNYRLCSKVKCASPHHKH